MIAENEKDVQLDIIEILISMLRSKAFTKEFSELQSSYLNILSNKSHK